MARIEASEQQALDSKNKRQLYQSRYYLQSRVKTNFYCAKFMQSDQ
jgi:hypothetical protein